MILKRRRRKTLVHVLRIACMFFAGLFVAAVIAAHQTDANSLKSNIVASLEQAAGLPVEINGEMSWKLSLRPRIILNDVRIRNADWAKHKYAVQIPQMLVQINLISLLRDSATIQSVKMIRPVVNIEQNANGDLSVSPRPKVRGPKPADDGRHREFPFDFDFGIGSLELDRPQIFLIDSAGIESFTPDRVKIGLQNRGDSTDYAGQVADGDGVYPFVVSFQKYDDVRKVFPVRLTVAGNAASLVADMSLRRPGGPPSELEASGTIMNLPSVGASFGLDLPKIARTDFVLSLVRKKKIISGKFSLKSKQSDLAVSGKYDYSGRLPKIAANIKSNSFDLVEFFPTIYGYGGVWSRPDRPLNVFRDVPLFGETLSMLNADMRIDIGSLRAYRGLFIRNAGMNIGLKDSGMIVSLDAVFADGRIKARAEVKHEGGGMLRVVGAGIGRGIVAGKIMSSVDEPDYISDLPSDFDFLVRGRGDNLSDLVSSAWGPVRVASAGGGYALDELVSLIWGRDFLTSIGDKLEGIFMGRGRSSRLHVQCAAANLKIRDGRIDMDKNVAVQTQAVNIRAYGHVDFGRENLEIKLDTAPVEGLKLSLSGNFINSVEFAGSLAEPLLRANRDAVAGKVAAAVGVGLVAGILTGGVGLIVGAGAGLIGEGMLGNLSADPQPCRTALTSGVPAAESGDPDFMNEPVDKLAREFINKCAISS
jgi:hypothetical protein